MNRDDDRTRIAVDREAIHLRVATLSDACRSVMHLVLEDPNAVRAAGRVLSLDKSLASKLVRVAQATDPSAVLDILPGPRGWSQIVAAFAAVDREGIATQAVREAVAALETELSNRGHSRDFIRAWGTDSESTASLTGVRRFAQVRSSLTRNHAAVWGIAGTAILRSFVVRSMDVPDRMRLGAVTTVQGIHRTSPGPDWPIHDLLNRRADEDTGSAEPESWPGSIACDDLCSAGGGEEAGFLINRAGAFRTFNCYRTGPSVRIDLVFAEVASDSLPIASNGSAELTGLEMPILLPASIAVIDAFVDRRSPLAATPRIETYIEAGGIRLPGANRSHHRLPATDHAESLERIRSEGMHPPDDPDIRPEVRAAHATATERVMKALELDASSVVRHRALVTDPLLSTSIRMSWPS